MSDFGHRRKSVPVSFLPLARVRFGVRFNPCPQSDARHCRSQPLGALV